MSTMEVSREETELLICALYAYKKALKEEPQTDGVIRAGQLALDLILRLEGLLQERPRTPQD